MSASGNIHLTPEQVTAVTAGSGFAHAEDPSTHRVYLLVEQGQAPTLADDYFRQKIAEGLAEAERGESQPWDVEAMKAELRRRHADRTAQS
jgi:hypothetical protein